MSKDTISVDDFVASIPTKDAVTRRMVEYRDKAKACRTEAAGWDRKVSVLRHVLKVAERANPNTPTRKRGPRKPKVTADAIPADVVGQATFEELDATTHEEAAALV